MSRYVKVSNYFSFSANSYLPLRLFWHHCTHSPSLISSRCISSIARPMAFHTLSPSRSPHSIMKKKPAKRITIEQAAKELRAAWLEHNSYDKPEIRAITDRIYALEYVISTQMAQTPLEAMAQIALIEGRNDNIGSSVMADPEGAHRQIVRMTYSVMAYLERESGIPRRRVGGEQYMPASLDPWQSVEADAA